MHPRTFIVLAAVAGIALSGCEQLRTASGQEKESPDEFAVVTKAPLVVPPDFNLKPPAPGEAPTNQIEPTQAAQNALVDADVATVASTLPATMSPGERYFLAAAGVQNADPAIRQQLASDIKGMRATDDSFANSVLFWNGPSTPPGSVPVDADAEARRIDAARAGNGTPSAAPAPTDSGDSSDNGSWLGDLWPF
jgi:hypothetical protein